MDMNSLDNTARMLEAIRQTDAIFALEGFQPTAQKQAIDAAVVAGRVTENQVIAEMVAYAKLHKTTEGFAATRTWT